MTTSNYKDIIRFTEPYDFFLHCSWIQYKHEASPCGLAWLWDTAGKLEIIAKAELLWEAHIWTHKNCLILDQTELLPLAYFKQYLFAAKSRKYSTMPSLTLTVSPEDHKYKPFFPPLPSVYFQKIEAVSFHCLSYLFFITYTGHSETWTREFKHLGLLRKSIFDVSFSYWRNILQSIPKGTDVLVRLIQVGFFWFNTVCGNNFLSWMNC